MKLSKRDIRSGLTFYQAKGSDKQTKHSVEVVEEEIYVLVKPIRLDEDGRAEVVTFLSDDGPKSNFKFDPGPDGDDDDDDYVLMGRQVWLVYNTKEPSHKFRKIINYLMGESFSKYSERKQRLNDRRLEKGFPDIDSIAYREYKLKDKNVLKGFRDDDFLDSF